MECVLENLVICVMNFEVIINVIAINSVNLSENLFKSFTKLNPNTWNSGPMCMIMMYRSIWLVY